MEGQTSYADLPGEATGHHARAWRFDRPQHHLPLGAKVCAGDGEAAALAVAAAAIDELARGRNLHQGPGPMGLPVSGRVGQAEEGGQVSAGHAAPAGQVPEQRDRGRPRQAEAAHPAGAWLQDAEDGLRDDQRLRSDARSARDGHRPSTSRATSEAKPASSSAPSASALLPWPRQSSSSANGSNSRRRDRHLTRLAALTPTAKICNRALGTTQP